MKTYDTSFGISFTEEELKGKNPYLKEDGSSIDGLEEKAWAFKEAKQQHLLDQMPDDKREEYLKNKRMFQDRLNSEQA